MGLVKSISSISRPEKKRSLDAKRDFTIATTIKLRLGSDGPQQKSSNIMNCCAPSAVKKRKDTGSAKERFFLDFRDVTEETYYPAARGSETVSDESANFRMPPVSESGVDSGVEYDDGNLDDATSAGNVNFTFTDYSPMCYRHIREFFSVDAKDFLDVLSGSKWHSIPTPGKSAAQLFFCGRDWVIKTMTTEESEFLRTILHRYYYHVRDNSYTLLPHFVGHYHLEVGRQRHNFVIMQNVFATPHTIHEKFDLKGSTIGRYASTEEKRRATCTQKDLDINRPINIGKRRSDLLIQQVRKDCDFLKNSNIMDYSFLLGVHVLPNTFKPAPTSAPTGTPRRQSGLPAASVFGSPQSASLGKANTVVLDGNTTVVQTEVDEAQLDGQCFTAYEGGMLSDEVPGLPREIYFIGIIDILQRYNTRKHMETMFFGTLKDFERISCVDPNSYASRFISFMTSIIV
ncbi:1-phosphatidylinositol-4-phosphate 5-kinase [Angomonas deanei]|uniref:Phosphatidylinositol-4-phosphate 5-Kinase, putative n=1 Tax=Angomonas deanei TaxID=59799 RepID=A0A7G2C5X1_9TRYP|nr:1-phosphatidylinositol-4-phosphate 5-kinase [Angomonas deanei]CAD2214895.1 Phosphatidylinositol-4-phosphate 5-Kinase, putative [Angomonas deanei]|eukprot:EPY29987.1 1-phosphatidylinositol-4-phosphate 5-kinase [Angomonas deanei]